MSSIRTEELCNFQKISYHVVSKEAVTASTIPDPHEFE